MGISFNSSTQTKMKDITALIFCKTRLWIQTSLDSGKGIIQYSPFFMQSAVFAHEQNLLQPSTRLDHGMYRSHVHTVTTPIFKTQCHRVLKQMCCHHELTQQKPKLLFLRGLAELCSRHKSNAGPPHNMNNICFAVTAILGWTIEKWCWSFRNLGKLV